jgi:ABC-type transport system involved in cytochrome c biogenesis permease subunit
MKPFADILCLVMPILYAALVLVYGVTFFRTNHALARLRFPFLLVTAVLHLFYLTARGMMLDHPPITSVFEIMSLLAASISVAYIYIEWRTRTSSTGVYILFLSFAFQTVSSLFIRDNIAIPEYLHSLVLGFHVTAALLGYTGISLSAVYGCLYLMLYHEIKSTRFGLIYSRLPSLEMLETMSSRSEVFGFALLSVAIGIGLIWLPKVFETFSYWDPKLVGTVFIWLLYAVALGAKRGLGWQGRKTIVISLVAFGFVFLSMTVINLYLSGFHSFH